jgi:hypothetical protein
MLLHRFSFEPVRASSAFAYWTGYVNNDPVQESLFSPEEEELRADVLQEGL